MVFCRGHRCYLFSHRCYLFTSFIFFCYNTCCCPCALGIASSAALIMGSGKLLSFSNSVNSSFNKLAILNQQIVLSIQVIFFALLQFTAIGARERASTIREAVRFEVQTGSASCLDINNYNN
jgi:hypothetical protein